MSSYQNSSGNQPCPSGKMTEVTPYERTAEKLVDGETSKAKAYKKAQDKKKGKG